MLGTSRQVGALAVLSAATKVPVGIFGVHCFSGRKKSPSSMFKSPRAPNPFRTSEDAVQNEHMIAQLVVTTCISRQPVCLASSQDALSPQVPTSEEKRGSQQERDAESMSCQLYKACRAEDVGSVAFRSKLVSQELFNVGAVSNHFFTETSSAWHFAVKLLAPSPTFSSNGAMGV